MVSRLPISVTPVTAAEDLAVARQLQAVLAGMPYRWTGFIPDETVLVARRRGAIVGTVSYTANDAHAYVHDLIVRPRSRGTGVGSALMDGLHEAAVQKGFSHLHLLCRPSLVPFYERLGYTPVQSQSSIAFLERRVNLPE